MALGGLDLNLLPTLHALLETRNVTRAGERLHLSQPATSSALSRLRRHFDDELLVRVGREMQLTPLAQTLLPLVTEALVQVERTFDVRLEFDASTSDRRFRVRASDYATCMVNEPLRRLLSLEAPGVSVQFTPQSPDRLASGTTDADLLVAPVGYGVTGPHDVVLRDHFVAVVSRQHAALTADCDVVSLLADLPHAVGTFGDDVVTPADRLMEQLDIPRKVAATVPGLLALPMLVIGTDLIALIPNRLARRFDHLDELMILEVPGSMSTPLVEAIFWDPSRTADAALQWLRGIFVRACERLGSE
ncbi:MAG TPA: LysR family transcriptional regulator [Actinomycetes bacterium]|nr:LysR family transcriptional regulator [Actinomycetes bacterium]